MKAADLFLRCLEKQGVKYMFGVPGEENLELMDAIKDSPIQFIVTRHETGGAFIAGVMGYFTGTPGVCLATLGPGATNMVTGVATANMDGMPIVAITGQAELSNMHEEYHQYFDLVELYKPVTKWSSSVKTAEGIPEIIGNAFLKALSGRTGAAHIELPKDVAAMPVQADPLPKAIVPSVTTVADEVGIREAAKAINEAKCPLVLIGKNVVREDVSTEIASLLEKINAPFTETFMAKGVMRADHPFHLQTTGIPQKDFIHLAFEHADLIITIGYDMVEYGPKKWNSTFTPVVHIHTMEAEKDRYYPIKASLLGNIKSNLDRLAQMVKRKEKKDPFYDDLKKRIDEDARLHVESDAFPMVPERIIADIRSVLAEDDILLSDVGAHKVWIGRHYNAFKPNTCIISNGLATMGIALPGAIGAKLANPDRKVVAVCGDGSFVMSSPEIETAVRLNLPIVILVWRDGRYGLIEWKQINEFHRASNIEFGDPDFAALAKAYGATGYKISKADEFKPTLQKALSHEGPVIIECPYDYKENFRLSERLKKLQ